MDLRMLFLCIISKQGLSLPTGKTKAFLSIA